ncbi:MAG: helix-turn-helix domain-containing protein [Treponema sp.]|nr:helix-turn-helix domain-containing protein [Treponema sp.]
MFFPLTSTPFSRTGYRELLPSEELAPYVRCFWTSWNQKESSPQIQVPTTPIIPDLCADIIIATDGTENKADGRKISSMHFCGVSDKMFLSSHSQGKHRRLFGIRFYAWQASHFSDQPLIKTANGFFDLQTHFQTAKKLLLAKLSPVMNLEEFKQLAQETLLQLLFRPASKIPEQAPLVQDAIIQMIRTRGSQQLSSIIKDIHTSERQLERFFAQALSLSPKKVSSLIRYQSLWQSACLSKNFDVQDAVANYGYFDQAHLLNDFKKFHGMNLTQARKLALKSK